MINLCVYYITNGEGFVICNILVLPVGDAVSMLYLCPLVAMNLHAWRGAGMIMTQARSSVVILLISCHYQMYHKSSTIQGGENLLKCFMIQICTDFTLPQN